MTSHQMLFPGKKGACFILQPNQLKTNLTRIDKLQPFWNYSWGVDLSTEQPPDVEFVPMTWGRGMATAARLQEAVVPHIKEGRIKCILAFNEPDHREQSNMTVAAAIQLWPNLEKLGIPLCSPSCASPLRHGDNHWMEDFMNEVEARNYRVDYVGVHWYGEPNARSFQNRLRQVYEKYGHRPLLITEFAVADWSAKTVAANRYTAAQVLAFMKTILPWIESQEWIAGYCWFPFAIQSSHGSPSALFDEHGNLTPCGQYYRSVGAHGDQEVCGLVGHSLRDTVYEHVNHTIAAVLHSCKRSGEA